MAQAPPGWPLVKAICDWVHHHITFGYHFADSSKSAFDVYNDPRGVCRDFSHLALAFCRCMNIPARYVTGYMGDIGVPVVLPMDFSGWFEVYLGDRWYTLDARHNKARIGRIVMARRTRRRRCRPDHEFRAGHPQEIFHHQRRNARLPNLAVSGRCPSR